MLFLTVPQKKIHNFCLVTCSPQTFLEKIRKPAIIFLFGILFLICLVGYAVYTNAGKSMHT